MIALIARGKSLIAPGGARIARCPSREAADLLALYVGSTAFLLALAPDAPSVRALRVELALAEKALLQTVTLKPSSTP